LGFFLNIIIMEFFIATLLALFSIVDPPGALPVYVAMTSGLDAAERKRIALKTSLYFMLILISFFLAGTYILSFFGLTIHALRIAGGIVLTMTGLSLMSTHIAQQKELDEAAQVGAQGGSDISFSPLAMPLLSGPGSISFLITQYHQHPSFQERGFILAAIVAVAVMVWGTLRLSPFLFRVLGTGGLNAVARIMGFIVLALGVQFIVNGGLNLAQDILAHKAP
jgi:multiple antibiotic resistance protein